MIDTIVLLLSKDMFSISDPDKFTPSARWVTYDMRTTYGMQSRQGPTKKELKNGCYKPRLLLANRVSLTGRRDILLKVELSLPKLFFGNNVAELVTKDFQQLAQLLADILATMGVMVTSESLARAVVSGVHYSKNIPLTDGSTPYYYINKIKEANIKLSLDTAETDYRNDGHGYKWHCKAYEVAFYDKIKELGHNQLAIVDGLRGKKKFELLRMEVRLNNRKKIKQLFAKLRIKSDLTFKSVFKKTIAQKVLIHYLDELEGRRPVLLDYKPRSDQALLVALKMSNPDLSPKRLLELYGFKKALEVYTLRELRNMLAVSNDRAWLRLMADVQKIRLPAVNSPFAVIRDCLVKFKAIKVK